MRVLIVSDGRKGHENQSIAYAKLKGASFDIVQLRFKHPLLKALTYLLDPLRIYTDKLFEPFEIEGDYDEVVGAGSGTYYGVKLLAKRLGAKAVALMNPKGFRKGFDTIYTPYHDGGKLPINFAQATPLGLYRPKKRCVALVVGGSNSVFSMDKEALESVVEYIFEHFKEYEKALTTSPRTPKEIEEWLDGYGFDYKVIYSKHPVNPLGDFIHNCDYLFVTIDSTSMISEAVSGGKAAVEVVPLHAKKRNKYQRMVENLAQMGALHIFDGGVGKAQKKIELKEYL
ncbi:MAG: hypothetical protein GXO16_03910 [Epsilonproteobacteria bacterium]|nr:hypothetical protein [Campylobacterota bacterium]